MPRRPRWPITVTFEEISAAFRSSALQAYLDLLDYGYPPERIAFRQYNDMCWRVEGTLADGRDGVSCPVIPADPLPTSTTAGGRTDPNERAALLTSLLGERIRVRWRGGHLRTGRLERDPQDRFYLVPWDTVRLRPRNGDPTIEPHPARSRGGHTDDLKGAEAHV
jgi:hypothetical protein